MSITSTTNYCVSLDNKAYPPCTGGGYVNVIPGTQSSKAPTTATFQGTGPLYTVTPFQTIPSFLLFIGDATLDLAQARMFKQPDAAATDADKKHALMIDQGVIDTAEATGLPVKVNVWMRTAGDITTVYVEPR